MIDTMTTTWVPASTFGSRLAEARRVRGLTVEEAAELCAIKPATWSLWEREGSAPRNMGEVAEKVENGLGVDRSYLMWGNIPEGAVRLSRESETTGQASFSGSDIEEIVSVMTPMPRTA